MDVAWAVSWNDSKKRRLFAAAFAVFLMLPLTNAATATTAGRAFEDLVTVIVREFPGAGGASEGGRAPIGVPITTPR